MDYTQHIIMTRRATAGYCGRIKFDDVQVAARERYNDWMAWAPRRVRIANLIATGLLEDDDDDSHSSICSDSSSDTFECPECHNYFIGDDANDMRVWVPTVCDCGRDDPECYQCGYDVCVDCETACTERDGRKSY